MPLVPEREVASGAWVCLGLGCCFRWFVFEGRSFVSQWWRRRQGQGNTGHWGAGGWREGGSRFAIGGGMEGGGARWRFRELFIFTSGKKRRNSLTCRSHAATVLHGGCAACTEVHCGSGSCLVCLFSKQKGSVLVDSMHSHPSGGASKKRERLNE